MNEEVGRDDRAVGPAEPRSTEERTVLPADLVLEALEVDDVGVHGDADRHDDARGPGQREQPARLAQERDERQYIGAQDRQAQPHHQPER